MEPRKVVAAWVEAFNQADIDLVTSFYADDAVNHQVANDKVVGKEAIRARFKEEFDAAEMVCIVENIFQDGEWAILEWKDPLGLRGCGFFHIRDSKIKFQRAILWTLSCSDSTIAAELLICAHDFSIIHGQS